MKRFLGISFAAFVALIAFALVCGDASAGLRKNCHGGRRCHGRQQRERGCHGGLFHRRKNRCHGEQASCCEAGDCANGACGGGEVVTEEAAPTEAAPEAPKKAKKAKKA